MKMKYHQPITGWTDINILLKGSLALFFGGEEILLNPNLKQNQKGSPINPAFFLFSLILQTFFFIFKKLKMKFIMGTQYSTNYLQCIIVSGRGEFKNMYCYGYNVCKPRKKLEFSFKLWRFNRC